jgi:transcriptional regulator with XRE-family HTH domain
MRHVRKFLGQRLRLIRKQRGWSQQKLGARSGLSGKFIGEVERGEKSISVDSLYSMSLALEIPLKTLTDVPSSADLIPTEDAEKLFALLIQNRTPRQLRRAYGVLRALFGQKALTARR